MMCMLLLRFIFAQLNTESDYVKFFKSFLFIPTSTVQPEFFARRNFTISSLFRNSLELIFTNS